MRQFMIAAAGVVVGFGGLAAIDVNPAEAQVQTRGAPRGSYAQSCTGAYVNQGRLYADCQDYRGNMRETSIELARCSSSDISNIDGRLTCGRYQGDYERPGRPGRPGRPDRPVGGWGPGGGWGGGQHSITIYRDADYRGQSLSFRDEVRDLRRSGMNDATSSIRLRGSWEVCVDADFRGRCEIVHNDVRDLRNSGINDRISSMRPVRGGRW